MGGDLVGRRSGQRIAKIESGQQSTQDNSAATTADVEFVGRVPTWQDLPPESQRLIAGLGTPIVEHVEQYDSLAWRIDGVHYQKAVGWRAYADQVVVVTALRPLESEAGKLRPSGPWQHHSLESYAAQASPTRRHGSIPPGELRTEQGTRNDGGPRIARHHQRAAQALAYLPAKVRRSVAAAVPEPVIWSGEITQQSDSLGYPHAQRVEMLRMDARRAIVISAKRSLAPLESYRDLSAAKAALARTAWDASQVTYELAPGKAPGRALERP